MYKQIKLLNRMVTFDQTETLEAMIPSIDFDGMAESLLNGVIPSDEDVDVTLEQMLLMFIETLKYIEEETSIESVLDDTTYDKLVEEYINLTGKPISGLHLPRQDESMGRPTRRHKYPELVGTLDKVHFTHMEDIPEKDTRKSFEQWLTLVLKKCKDAKISTELTIGANFKYDGLSVVLECEKDKVIHAVTRRDTDENLGLDVSHIMAGQNTKELFPNLPKDIYQYNYGVKIESMMRWNQYHDFTTTVPRPPKHRRSAMSMIINTLEESYKKEWFDYITAPVLQVSVDHELVLEPEEKLKWIYAGESNGNHMYINNEGIDGSVLDYVMDEKCIGQFLEVCDDIIFPKIKENAEDSEIPIDGCVFTIYNPEVIELLGRKDSINKFQVAYKFPAGEMKTTLKNVNFQVGTIAGTITPVAEVEPVKIGGSTITNIGLSNYSKLERLNLHIGDEVIVQYDIVPKLHKDKTCKCKEGEPITGPKECPVCGELLHFNIETVRCVNPACGSRLAGRITNYLNKMGIDGIGLNTVMDLVEHGMLHSIGDLYRLDTFKEDIIKMKGYGETSYNNMITAINKKLQYYPHQVLGSIGIPDVGRRIMEKICREMTVKEILSDDPASIDKMLSIKGIGDKIVERISAGVFIYKNDISDILHYITLLPYEEVNENPSEVVLFTGVRDKDFAEYLEKSCNCTMAGSFTKKVTLLIYGKHSSKVDKAQEQNIKIMTLTEAKEHFNYKEGGNN